MSLPFLLTFLLFLRFSKRESARDRRSSRWQKDSFVLSRPFQLIFIVCLLGQASVASHGTLLFVIVACVPRHSVFLPASFRRVEGTHLPFQTDDSRHCTWSIKSYGYGAFASNDVPSARGGYRTSSRMISRQPPRVSSSANPFQPREAHLLHLDVYLPRSVYAVRGTRRSS